MTAGLAVALALTAVGKATEFYEKSWWAPRGRGQVFFLALTAATSLSSLFVALALRRALVEPAEVARVAKAFEGEQARVVFLTLVLTGIRRSELQALRWQDVDLVEMVLRVRDSKSEDGRRSIALSPALAEALWQRRRETAFQGDGERVFCHEKQGTIYLPRRDVPGSAQDRSQGRWRGEEAAGVP